MLRGELGGLRASEHEIDDLINHIILVEHIAIGEHERHKVTAIGQVTLYLS